MNGENPMDEAAAAHNINAADIDEETKKKLRGDRIGDTMYSQAFVVKTLMTLYRLQWSKELEDDLCFLWDMSVENDVCKYLYEMGYPEIAGRALAVCNEQRFVEITIGIFANLLCSECRPTISMEDIYTTLSAINTDDPLTLIQVMRFIIGLSNKYVDEIYVNNEILSRIIFILNNSVNKDLLLKTLDAIQKLTTNRGLDIRRFKEELVNSVFVAYKTLLNPECDCRVRLILKPLLQIICNLCDYVSNYSDEALHNHIKAHLDFLLDQIAHMLQYYSSSIHLFPLTDEFDFFLEASSFIISFLSIDYKKVIFRNVIKIMHLILQNDCPMPKPCFEICTYLISVGDLGRIRRDLDRFKAETETETVKQILTYINTSEFDSDCMYKEKLLALLNHYKRE